MTTICTFNANNLFVRYRFEQNFPGAPPTRKPAGGEPVETTASATFGFLPKYEPRSFRIFNQAQRDLAAQALSQGEGKLPDVVFLQEIESLIALRTFNEGHLKKHYPQALLIDSRDYRQIDVGVLAGPKVEILDVRSHVDLPAPKVERYKKDWPWQFSRDCLEVHLALPGGTSFTAFVNHFKSKFVPPPRKKLSPAELQKYKKQESELAAEYRLHQAEAVVRLVHDRFPGQRFDQEWFAVVGDLNSLSGEAPAATLTKAGLEDAVGRLPVEERWTEYYAGGGSVGQLDYLFLSPNLAAATAGQPPVIERRGIGMRDTSKTDGLPLPKTVKLDVADDAPPAATVDFRFPRFPGVTKTDKASDHCPVFFDLP
jgi:hypothetical protein